MKNQSTVLFVFALLISPWAWSCPSENENLFLPQYEGEQNMKIGWIDAKTAIVYGYSQGNSFYLSAVELNGHSLCADSEGTFCGREVRLQNRALKNSDRVRLQFESYGTGMDKMTVIFERRGPVLNRGSLCKPLYPVSTF